MPTTFALYCFLFAAATLYALILSRFPMLDPDLTFVEVIIGTALCLLAATLDRRWNGPLSSEAYEWRVWEAFIVGGTPIVLWQIGKSIRAWHAYLRRILTSIYDNATAHPKALAEKRRAEPEADD